MSATGEPGAFHPADPVEDPAGDHAAGSGNNGSKIAHSRSVGSKRAFTSSTADVHDPPVTTQ
jgi:hypothetical protein